MRLGYVLVALIVTGCGGSDDANPEPCSPEHRRGPYLLSFTEISGTCGPVDSVLVRLEPDSPALDDCTITAADVVSADQCTLERSMECVLDARAWASYVATTTEQNGGDLITGTMTMNLFVDSSPACTSTYRIRYDRQ